MNFPDVLVLGATGRIGQILRACWREGISGKISQDRVLWQTRRPLAPQPGNWVTFDPLAPLDVAQLNRLKQGTILCLSGVIPGRETQGATLADNTALAQAALRLGAQTGARVLLTSSAAVYGDQPGPLDEHPLPRPLNAYGRAKLDMEQSARQMAIDLGVACSLLRIGNIAGIDSILGQWRPGFQLDRFADGRTPRRSYIGPASLAQVLAKLIDTPDLPDILNIATDRPIELGSLLDAAGLSWTPRAPASGAIAEVWLDTTRLQRVSAPDLLLSDPCEIIHQWHDLKSRINTEHASA